MWSFVSATRKGPATARSYHRAAPGAERAKTWTGRTLTDGTDWQAAVQAQVQRADAEAQRAKTQELRAESEARRADAEAQRADAEAQRADAAEAELARIRAVLARQG